MWAAQGQQGSLAKVAGAVRIGLAEVLGAFQKGPAVVVPQVGARGQARAAGEVA